MICSKQARSVALCSGVLALVSRSQAACPSNLDPYSDEPNPFGWPVTPAEFSYDHTECWAEKYAQCGGERQSPMEIVFGVNAENCALRVDGLQGALASRASYKILAGRPTVAVSKYLRGISIPGDLGSLRLQGPEGRELDYVAVDAILTAGMHSMGGVVPDAELLIVHEPKGDADAFASRVVISIPFRKSESHGSALFAQLGLGHDSIPDSSSWRAPRSVDLGDVTRQPLMGDRFSYDGSMPAPPCTENVRYFVMATNVDVSEDQLRSLETVLERFAGGTHKRAPVSRVSASGACRAIYGNSVEAPVAAFAAPASCNRWPVNITSSQTDASQSSRDAREFIQYRPTDHVTVSSSAHSMDASGDFGNLLLNGRLFAAKKVSLKPVASHTIDGHRHSAELVVEHVLFGDDFESVSHSAHGSHGADNSSGHRRLNEEAAGLSIRKPLDVARPMRRVLVSVPLKLGRENALLRTLGLGVKAHQTAIRHGNSYTVEGEVDLKAGLSASTSKGWYWYTRSDSSEPGCLAASFRWMVFEEPMEMSIEQLNTLALQVSGIDSTLPTKLFDQAKISKGFVPTNGIDDQWAPGRDICSTGVAQSPVDITTAAVNEVGNTSYLAKASWKPVLGLRVENDGSRIGFQSNQLGYSSVMGPDGFPKFYQVTDVALRMPSEHMIDGKQFAAELQVVQKNQKTVLEFDDDDVIISSFMFDIGDESKLLAQLLPESPLRAGDFVTLAKPVDLQWALGPSLDGPFYKYDGSYTTSDCQEAVQWTVFETAMTLSMEQYKMFRSAFPLGNTRPLQPLNGRRLLKNSFGERDPVDFDFFLNREMGRNKRETPVGYIIFPIIGTVLLCSVSMAAIFVREDRARKSASAGGLDSQAQTIGKGYAQM